MRVTQVVASVDDPAAGPSYSVTSLSTALSNNGVDLTLRSVAGWRGSPSTPNGAVFLQGSSGARLLRSPIGKGPLASRLCGSPALLRALQEDTNCVSIIHTHGLWLMPNVYPAWACRRGVRRPSIVISPRGMLGKAALAFSNVKKRMFWLTMQRYAARAASLFHATSEAEYSDIRAYGLKQPVAIVPNGVDIPPPNDQLVERAASTGREILYLGRLHPKKGIDLLVRAWARVARQRPEWWLRIVGPSELGQDHQLADLAQELSAPRVTINGPVYGDKRLATYRSADLFVLPTRNENFAMTVAEALAAGLPAIVTRGAPWSGLEREGCGWWIDGNIEALSSGLLDATSESRETLAQRGARGRAWMARDFSWNRVAADMADAYRWLQDGGTPPSTVRIN